MLLFTLGGQAITASEKEKTEATSPAVSVNNNSGYGPGCTPYPECGIGNSDNQSSNQETNTQSNWLIKLFETLNDKAEPTKE